MQKKTNLSKRQQIFSFLLLFSSAIVLAIGISLAMLNYYSPSGVYLGKNVLLSPENAVSIRFNEGSSFKNGNSRYVFDKIEFNDYDYKNRQMKKYLLNVSQYGALYKLLSKDESLLSVPEEVMQLFETGNLASLHLFIKEESKLNSLTTDFLTVEFIPNGDYYRVQLRVQANKDVWAYFHHSLIYQNILTLLRH